MDLTGMLSNWSKAFTVDLQFNSSSDNFGDLLRLVPETYAESIEGFQSRGTLDLGGTVQGPVTSDSIPRFDVRVNVQVYPESDVWAAGVMTYYLLSGRFCFDDWKNRRSPALSQLW
jgi:serine/threonine protein kinase